MMQAVIPNESLDVGVYVNLPDSVYHAAPSLGSTDIRRLLVGPSEFFYNWSGNPDRGPKTETEAMTLGKAFHLLLLEGRQAFDAAFACKPEGDGVLTTAEDMRAWLRVHGLHDKGTKEAMAERIHSVNPAVVIADKVLAEHTANGRTVLPFETYKRVLLAAQHVTSNPHLGQAFSGGVPELSVFFERNGIRLKARLDHVKVIKRDERRCALVTDLKTSAGPKFAQPLEEWVSHVAARYRIQAALYLEGLKAAKRHIRDGLVHGEANGSLNAIGSSETAMFAFCVLKSVGAPYASARLLSPSNPLIETSVREIDAALDEFRKYYEHFGVGTPWVSLNEPTELSVDELPKYLL